MKIGKHYILSMDELQEILQTILDDRKLRVRMAAGMKFCMAQSDQQYLDGSQVDERLSQYCRKPCEHWILDKNRIIIIDKE